MTSTNAECWRLREAWIDRVYLAETWTVFRWQPRLKYRGQVTFEVTAIMPINLMNKCVAFAILTALVLATGDQRAQAGELEAFSTKASCLIEANSVVKLSSATQGTLSNVLVKRGDHVRKGQTVAQLESDVELAMYEAAQLKASSEVLIEARSAEKVNADRKHDRVRLLQTREIASVQSLDEARTAAVLAQSALQQAQLERDLAINEARRLKAVVERRIIHSPVDGVVTKVDLHAGEYADPATPIAVIDEVRPIVVEVYLPIEAYPRVKIGMSAEVVLQEPIGGTHVGQIITKDPQIDSASGTFQITLKLPNDDETIPAGLRCSIHFLE